MANQRGKKSEQQPNTHGNPWRDAQVQLLLARVFEAQRELWECLGQTIDPTQPPPPVGHAALPLLPGFFTLDSGNQLLFTTNQGQTYTTADLLRDHAQIQINFYVTDAPHAALANRPDVLTAINDLVVNHSNGVAVVPAKATCCKN